MQTLLRQSFQTQRGKNTLSESFFNHYLDFFLGFIVIMLGSLAAITCVILFAITQSSWLLAAISTATMATLYYGMRYLAKFREFKEQLYLYFPKIENNMLKTENITNEIKEICKIDEELPLKCVRLFSKGLTYRGIQNQLALKHPQQVKRLLDKGIRNLLEAKTP
jgi:hypothetical protein